MLKKQEKQLRRHKRLRFKIKGTSLMPRLCVFRSAKHIYAQLIDDDKARVLLKADDFEVKKAKSMEAAKQVGQLIAKKAIEKKITKVVFDRKGYKYHGRVKALAEGAREGGLKF